MTIFECLRDLVDQRHLQGLEKLKMQGVLRSLDGTAVGMLDATCLALNPTFGQVIQVPGDDAPWLVYGNHGDGTFDIIRDQATGYKDKMVGYRMGDTISEYTEELQQEVYVPPTPPAKGKRGKASK